MYSSILARYILREILQTWLVVTVVLLLILVTNQFAAVLGDTAANKLPREAVLLVMGLTSVQYLTILVPVALFLSIMLSLARLYHDSEMAAMMACGVGPAGLYRALVGPALVLAVLVGWLALVVSPSAAGRVQALAEAARREASLGLLEAGRFISFGGGQAVLYAEGVTPDQHLHRVFVQRRVGDTVEVIVADEAWQSEAAGGDVRVLTFARGRRYEGQPGDPRFRILTFAEHGIPYALPETRPAALEPEARTSAALATAADSESIAELQWRVSVPLTLLVLVVVAVPLAHTEPRRGRFSGLGPAVLVYIIYANLLAASRGWLERDQVPVWFGLWWVHAVFLAVALLMLAHQQGIFRRVFRPPAPVSP